MSTVTAPRPAAHPAAPGPGTRVVARPPKDAETCKLKLTIRGVAYGVRPVPFDAEAGVSSLLRLRKLDGSATYYVAETPFGPTCDCPDYEFRHAGNGTLCKHARALLAFGLVFESGGFYL